MNCPESGYARLGASVKLARRVCDTFLQADCAGAAIDDIDIVRPYYIIYGAAMAISLRQYDDILLFISLVLSQF